jgi:hypothetical protein
MKYKRYILGGDLKKILNNIPENHMNDIVTAETLDGKEIFLTEAFGSVVDTDLEDQCSPDIALRAHKEPDDPSKKWVYSPTKTFTVKDLINSAADVERLERNNGFECLDVVILLHDITEDGYDEDYPDILPIEKIEFKNNGSVLLKCNKF